MKKTTKNTLLTLFLVIYGVVLFAHILEMGLGSWHVLAALFAGCAVAVVAHKRHGFIPLALLLVHMTIEWYAHALYGGHYTTNELVFHGIHAVFDITFLYLEAGAHFKKYRLALVTVVVAFLAGVFYFNFVPSISTEHLSPLYAQFVETHAEAAHDHDHSGNSLLHPLVLGGVLGCVLSHLIYKRRRA